MTEPDRVELFLTLDSCDTGMDEHRYQESDELTGSALDLFGEGPEPALRLEFAEDSQVIWQRRGEQPQKARYTSAELRPDLYFIDWLLPDDSRSSASIILDRKEGNATALWHSLPEPARAKPNLYERIVETGDLSAARVHQEHLGVGGPRSRPEPPFTRDLIGKRLLCDYGTDVYEHIYLNEWLYCWHCISGVGGGAAEVDECSYHLMAENLYLLIWREKLAPAVGIVLLDLDRMRSTGKLHYQKLTRHESFVNCVVGARLELLNETRYPAPRST
ncbi:MoaF C-terminal domain-containing protein [Saccharopolyspora taberi]|uniref:Molybdenum cofactor biosynthesis F family protein n=1 Tax=Saccharopolyspora taberi TaxID=60895 RepID=A0ABN3VHU6_9PSEU